MTNLSDDLAAGPLTGDDSSQAGRTPDFTAAAEPLRLFQDWLDDATSSEPNDPNAMALATVDTDGLPDVRMVLLKGFDERGFVFYTNTGSAKGRELAATMKAALVFHWKSLRRQVRVRGPVEQVSDAEADEYFATRPRGSRIGAWASTAVAAARQPLRAGEGGRGRDRPPCHRRHPPSTALDRLSHHAGARSNSGTTGRSGCMTASSSAARHLPATGPRRGSIRKRDESAASPSAPPQGSHSVDVPATPTRRAAPCCSPGPRAESAMRP